MVSSATHPQQPSAIRRIVRGLAIATLSTTLILPSVIAHRSHAFVRDGMIAQLDFGRLLLHGVRAVQFSNLSDQQEVQLGQDINRQMLESGQFRLSHDREAIALVNRIGDRLVPYSDRPDLPFTFQVVQDESINAFATAGGYVYITTGALRAADNRAQVASVLAHEMAHITERHVVERMQRSTFAQAGAQAVGLDDNALAAIAVELGVQRPHSREAEFEADQRGLMILVNAGYNPRAMPAFMSKLLGAGAPPQFLSTHPHTEDRIARLNTLIERDNLVERSRHHRQSRG